MRVLSLELENFRRFTHLKIADIPADTRLVVLVGPNGSGKTCVFDGFEYVVSSIKENAIGEQIDYHRKDPSKPIFISITTDKGQIDLNTRFSHRETLRRGFYIRSSYRFASEIQVSSLSVLPGLDRDEDRPKRMIDIDQRIVRNYQRLIVEPVLRLYSGDFDDKMGKDIREYYVRQLNDALQKVLDITVSDIGQPLEQGRNQPYFRKGLIDRFAFKNLSAGEKEVVDILIDLIAKQVYFNDTVYCIDEPELHINMAIQSRLIRELVEIIPQNCQLWIATHSLGFMHETLQRNDAVIIDFSEHDFDGEVELKPIVKTRQSLRSVYSVALEELADTVIPTKLVLCEGHSPERDEKLYRLIFGNDPAFSDVEFLSARNTVNVQAALLAVLPCINRALTPKRIYALIDRDCRPDGVRIEKMEDDTFGGKLIVLDMYSIENYLLHPEVITLLGVDAYREFLVDIVNSKLPEIKVKIGDGLAKLTKIERARLAQSPHPLLQLTSLPESELDRLYPLIPTKELAGLVLNHLQGKAFDWKDSKEIMLEKLARKLGQSTRNLVYIRLRELLLSKLSDPNCSQNDGGPLEEQFAEYVKI